MTPEERGKRIKEARIAKKMTQSEVVGTFITRNMLSRIESGAAEPSLKTLEYLASALDIPVASLMLDDEGEENPCPRSEEELLVSAKTLYREGRYAEAIETLGSLKGSNPLSDEFTAVRARCCLSLARELAEENSPKAAEYAKEAAALAETGFYADSGLKAEAVKLLGEIAEKLKKYYEDIISSL